MTPITDIAILCHRVMVNCLIYRVMVNRLLYPIVDMLRLALTAAITRTVVGAGVSSIAGASTVVTTGGTVVSGLGLGCPIVTV